MKLAPLSAVQPTEIEMENCVALTGADANSLSSKSAHAPSEILDSLIECLDVIEGTFGEHFSPDTGPCTAEVLCGASDCHEFGCLTDKIERARAAIAAERAKEGAQ